MIGAILITTNGPTPDAMAKHLRPAQKVAFKAIGTLWHRTMRPKHFTKAGAREYQYKPRGGEPGGGEQFKGSYLERKLRVMGHALPLVWSGESRSLTRLRDVRSTSKSARVVMRANKLNFRASPNAPDMREELRTISSSEQQRLTKHYEFVLTRELKRIQGRRTRRLA